MGRRAGHWIRCRVYQTRDCRIRRCSGRATRAAKLDRYSNFLASAGFGKDRLVIAYYEGPDMLFLLDQGFAVPVEWFTPQGASLRSVDARSITRMIHCLVYP